MNTPSHPHARRFLPINSMSQIQTLCQTRNGGTDEDLWQPESPNLERKLGIAAGRGGAFLSVFTSYPRRVRDYLRNPDYQFSNFPHCNHHNSLAGL